MQARGRGAWAQCTSKREGIGRVPYWPSFILSVCTCSPAVSDIFACLLGLFVLLARLFTCCCLLSRFANESPREARINSCFACCVCFAGHLRHAPVVLCVALPCCLICLLDLLVRARRRLAFFLHSDRACVGWGPIDLRAAGRLSAATLLSKELSMVGFLDISASSPLISNCFRRKRQHIGFSTSHCE